jgi:class 3 adenylate cyclase/tetratricopeptide (TPR) repeat protein/energy-coupling factor transporter ATP-binding protein EcfA2
LSHVIEPVTCASCGASNSPEARFCSTCGAGLVEAPGPLPAEERRLATIVFADISGFTNLSQDTDPEDLRGLVDECMAKLGEIVGRYGGSVDKVIGDALMAVFGAPVAHEDDPERAVRAALEMQRCAAENAAQWGDLSLSVGVNTGEVFFAPVGPDKRPTVMGSAVNAAQRLQAGAPPGRVLVGELTERATRPAIRYEDAGRIQVKPGEEPLPAWSAVEATAASERGVSAAPLIGRDRELARLQAIWEDVSELGRVEVVTLFGPPGIGKTRLTGELSRIVEQSGGRILRGRSLPYGQTGGYGAFAQQVSELAGIYETDAAPVARAKLERAVAAVLSEDVEDVVSHLAALMALETPGPVPDQPVILFSARRFVEALGREQPTMLVFEDLHWAQPGLLDLVETFAARVRDAPLFVHVLARPELLDLRPGWGGGRSNYTALELRPLSAEDSERLAQAVLSQRAEPLTRDVAERLRDTAEGNPLFIEELAASLLERAAGSAEELPTSVKGIIASRLDGLPADERAVLLDASVVGKIFWRGALARLRGDDAGLVEALDSLEARDLVRREPATRIEGDEEFSFKHMLIREVAYATLPKAVRRERHAGVARFIEEGAGDRVAESAATLAYHWREAGDAERELHYLLLAADRVWAQHAIPFFDRALELVPEKDAQMRQQIRLRRAAANVRAGAYGQAIPELDELLEELEGRDRFDALSARFRSAFWSADAQGAHHFAELARELADELGDEELQALALSFLAGAVAMDGDLEPGRDFGREALRLWKPKTHGYALATAHEWMSLNAYWRGDYEAAEEDSRLAFELGQEVYSVGPVVSGGAQLGLSLAGLGRHEDALALFERVVALGRELEPQPRFTSRAINMWAGVLHELFDVDTARAKNEEAIALGERATFPGSQVSGKIDLVFSDLVLGEVGRAEAALPALWKEAEATKGWHQWLWMTRLSRAAAEVALAGGRAEEAVERSREAIARAERHARLKYKATSRLVLGQALAQLGRPEEGTEELRRALAEAEELGSPQIVWQVAGALARALYAAGDDAGAETAAVQAQTTVDAFAATLSDERRERFLQAPQLANLIAIAR